MSSDKGVLVYLDKLKVKKEQYINKTYGKIRANRILGNRRVGADIFSTHLNWKREICTDPSICSGVINWFVNCKY